MVDTVDGEPTAPRVTLSSDEALAVETARLARLGGWELEVATSEVRWSPPLFEIFELEESLPPTLDEAIRFYHPDDRATIGDAIQRAIESGVAYDLELRVTTGRGRDIYVRTTGKPEFDGDVVVRLWGFLQDITERVRQELSLMRSEAALAASNQALQNAYIHTVEAMSLAIDARDPYTAAHQRDVSRIAVAIAESMGLPDDVVDGIRFGAMIHDLGKIAIPAEILNRPGKLGRIEFELVRTHPQVGRAIIADVDYPWPVGDVVLHHHERLDGSGYPDGLVGSDISTEARIVAVADVVEAMSSHRPYRPAFTTDLALQEITDHRGSLYDPDAVDACVRLYQLEGFSTAD